MSEQAREATGIEQLEVVADRGYFSGEEVLACDQAGITAYVPKPLTSGAKADGRFGKQDFAYLPDRDEYRCPAGHSMTRRFDTVGSGLVLNVYATPECRRCLLKRQCTTGPERRIRRWEHEAVIDAMQERLSKAPEQMRLRRQTVEHPFGTLKAWMGATHFLTKTLDRVSTEMSLHVLAYNFKRLLNIMGAELMREVAAA
jgi:transposase